MDVDGSNYLCAKQLEFDGGRATKRQDADHDPSGHDLSRPDPGPTGVKLDEYQPNPWAQLTPNSYSQLQQEQLMQACHVQHVQQPGAMCWPAADPLACASGGLLSLSPWMLLPPGVAQSFLQQAILAPWMAYAALHQGPVPAAHRAHQDMASPWLTQAATGGQAGQGLFQAPLVPAFQSYLQQSLDSPWTDPEYGQRQFGQE